MSINIPINRLNKNAQSLTEEEIILLLNTVGEMKKIENPMKGLVVEKNIAESIENFEISKGGSHCGDFVISKKKYPNIRIMVEIKNYTSTIPRTQFEKFQRDIDDNQFSGGVLICNQPVSGADIINGNIAIIQSYDPNIINPVCEFLWATLFDKQFYKFLDYKNNIVPHCNILLDNIGDLVKIKKSVENLQKESSKTLQNVIYGINKTIQTINDMTNNIINESSVVVLTQKLNQFYLPDITNPILPLCRDKLKAVLEKICKNGSILLAHKANKYEYSIEGKKITINFLATKIDVSFEPAILNFENYIQYISFADGIITVKITAKNSSDDNVYNTITSLWK